MKLGALDPDGSNGPFPSVTPRTAQREERINLVAPSTRPSSFLVSLRSDIDSMFSHSHHTPSGPIRLDEAYDVLHPGRSLSHPEALRAKEKLHIPGAEVLDVRSRQRTFNPIGTRQARITLHLALVFYTFLISICFSVGAFKHTGPRVLVPLTIDHHINLV